MLTLAHNFWWPYIQGNFLANVYERKACIEIAKKWNQSFFEETNGQHLYIYPKKTDEKIQTVFGEPL